MFSGRGAPICPVFSCVTLGFACVHVVRADSDTGNRLAVREFFQTVDIKAFAFFVLSFFKPSGLTGFFDNLARMFVGSRAEVTELTTKPNTRTAITLDLVIRPPDSTIRFELKEPMRKSLKIFNFHVKVSQNRKDTDVAVFCERSNPTGAVYFDVSSNFGSGD